MKRLFALLLVVIMVLSLVACKKPVDDPEETTAGNNNNTTAGQVEKPFKGKTLQVWGFGLKDAYTDMSTFSNNYLWMRKAAIDEWAALNEVTIEYFGGYNKDQLLAAQGGGAKPDLIATSNNFPTAANLGIFAQFTEEEYNKIAEVVDSRFLDMMDWRGGSWGVVMPWTGNEMVYYNKSMFERAGVKSPGDYFAEGNWTWTTFGKCIDATTKDTDNDGVYDIYGCNYNTWASQSPQPSVDAEGKLTMDVVDQAYTYDWAAFGYEYSAVKKTMGPTGSMAVMSGKHAMQISDAESYNWKHQYQTLANGDEIRVVPAPVYDGKDELIRGHFTQSTISMLAGCDEREATVDLLCYILQAGMKYMSDLSDGLLETTHPGIIGATTVSKGWLEKFNADLAARDEALKDVDDYDKDFHAKVVNWFYQEDCVWSIDMAFAGCGEVASSIKVSEPPATAIEKLRSTWQGLIDTFNQTYIY